MSKTVTVQIGNTDNKLSQEDWSCYVDGVDECVRSYCSSIHFFGAPPNYSKWQNAAWVFECDEVKLGLLRETLSVERGLFNQESIAFTVGETAMI